MFDRAIRTENKNLLVGILSYRDGKLCIVIKSRGKEDIITTENLLKIINEFMLN